MPALWQIAFGLVLMAATAALHAGAILVMLGPVRRRLTVLHPLGSLKLEIATLCAAVLALALLHIGEAVVWAACFDRLGAVDGMADAFYFTLVTLTTLGYGDLVPDAPFRLVAGLCALTGLMATGMTTASLIELLRRFAVHRIGEAG